ncbi:MAG: caspase family protein [Proteobacteria bacterium]|nr:caspase family protein [Pseudomonadota bacterium]
MGTLPRIFTTLVFIAFYSTTAYAEKHALIVGVTDYPALKNANLVGPANDAALVSAVLAQRGFDSTHMVELSERPEAQGKPLRKNILSELEKLASTSQPGDFVFLHFAGHGSRQPAQPDDTSETDGLDEIFLPADAAKWDSHIGSVVNAITDNEMGAYLDRIRDRGADVWMVFDSCHSGTMTRGGGFGEVRYRQLAPGTLGIPESSSIKSRGKSALPADETQSFITDNGDNTTAKRGYLIAFSAAQSNQTTPEMSLPRKGEHRSVHGVFTYNMMNVLSRYRSISYEQLGQQILEQYRTMPWRGSQPMISGGSNLNAAVFNEGSENTDIWPATTAHKSSTIEVSAGRLQNFSPGARINLYARPVAQEDDYLGQAVVASAEALSSSATLIDTEATKLPKKVYTLLKEPALDFTLSVAALPSRGLKPTELRGLKSAIESAIDSNPMLVAWKEGEIADLRVSLFEGALWFLSPDQSLPCEYQDLTTTGRQRCDIERSPQRLLTVPTPPTSQRVEDSIGSALTRIARVENLLRMQAHMGSSGTADNSPLQVTLTVKQGGETRDYPLTEIPVFGDGDEVTVHIKNVSRKPQDVSLLYRDAMYGIVQIWPESGDSNRVQAGDQLAPIVLELYPEPEGLEDFIIMSQPGDGISRDFSFLEQEPLGVRSRSGGSNSAFSFREQEQPSALQLLLDTALYSNEGSAEKFKVQSRGGRKKSKPNLGSMKIYSWEVRR